MSHHQKLEYTLVVDYPLQPFASFRCQKIYLPDRSFSKFQLHGTLVKLSLKFYIRLYNIFEFLNNNESRYLLLHSFSIKETIDNSILAHT